MGSMDYCHESLANAIMKVLVNSDIAGQLKRKGKEKVKAFTLENMARKVEKIYNGLILNS